MKLRQNARELVLLDLSGTGLLLGEVRYNKQTETVAFALEKSAFFDFFFPCSVSFDPQRGPLVHPHVINAMTTSSIRIQRDKVNFFVLSPDIAPALKAQYLDIISQVMGPQGQEPAAPARKGRSEKGVSRVVEIIKLKGKKDSPKDKK
ncbi:MAG: hypothetical protein GXO58_07615 [Thermodesulfobacteria bacterium]|nr:hypothetical protein [Thermodesulfobacteriota bacterium]